jgi:hypothetical protein
MRIARRRNPSFLCWMVIPETNGLGCQDTPIADKIRRPFLSTRMEPSLSRIDKPSMSERRCPYESRRMRCQGGRSLKALYSKVPEQALQSLLNTDRSSSDGAPALRRRVVVRNIVVDLEVSSLFTKRKQRVDPVSPNGAILVAKAMQQIDDSRCFQASFALASSECFLQQNLTRFSKTLSWKKWMAP